MNMYRILFGRLMAPETEDAAGGAPDRGDVFAPPAPDAADADTGETQNEAQNEDIDGKAGDGASGDGGAGTDDGEQPRDAKGKFTAKPKNDEDDPKIPKRRFDEQLAKERQRAEAAERRAAEYEAEMAKNRTSADIKELETKVVDLRKLERKALIDGNEDKAAELSAEADRLNRQIAIAEAQQLSGKTSEQMAESIRFETTLERIEEVHPELRYGDPAYDQDLVDDVLDKQAGLMARLNLSPSRAMAQAAETIMERYHAGKPTQQGENVNADDEKAAGLAAGAAKTAERKAAAVVRNIDAAKRQPGSLKDTGLDSDKAGQSKSLPNVNDLTYEEFNALPQSTRAKMRGDFA